MSTPTRCMAVDDHPTVRQGLGLMFGLAPDLELVGSVENGADAIARGARGCVMKGSPPEDLLRAIRTVTTGKPFVDPSLSPALLMSQVGPDAPLSERERSEERRVGKEGRSRWSP